MHHPLLPLTCHLCFAIIAISRGYLLFRFLAFAEVKCVVSFMVSTSVSRLSVHVHVACF